MKNTEWMIENGYKCYDLDYSIREKGEYDIFIRNTLIDTIKTNDSPLGAILKWLDMEHNALDNSERCYLYNIIRPFRSEIRSIEKSRTLENSSDRIVFYTKDCDVFYLPKFKMDTMYVGMEPNKIYTLEALGL